MDPRHVLIKILSSLVCQSLFFHRFIFFLWLEPLPLEVTYHHCNERTKLRRQSGRKPPPDEEWPAFPRVLSQPSLPCSVGLFILPFISHCYLTISLLFSTQGTEYPRAWWLSSSSHPSDIKQFKLSFEIICIFRYMPWRIKGMWPHLDQRPVVGTPWSTYFIYVWIQFCPGLCLHSRTWLSSQMASGHCPKASRRKKLPAFWGCASSEQNTE